MIFQRFGRIARIDAVPAGVPAQFTSSDRHVTRREQGSQSVHDLTGADVVRLVSSLPNPDAESVEARFAAHVQSAKPLIGRN